VEHVVRMVDRRGTYKPLGGRSEGKMPLGRSRRVWDDNIKWILKNWDGEECTGLIGLRVGTGGGLCECGNELMDFIKCGEFLDWLRTG